MMPLTLPEPDKAAQMHSARLCEMIRAEIDTAGGAMPFRRYMEMALYTPGLGYYMAGARKFGAAGDFVTAPEISPLFSDCLAAQCQQVLETFERPACLLELGAGSGTMAADILARLERLDCLPDHYYILELSAELKQRQQQTLARRVPHLAASVRWLDTLDGLELHGVILANEVLDAQPVTRFRLDEEGLHELGVGYDRQGFRTVSMPASPDLAQQVAQRQAAISEPWGQPYESEFNPQLDGWMSLLANTLAAGAILLIDYGYVRTEYYHPERNEGTLIGHYHHRVTEDPFLFPGLQDLTASVDFTAVAEAGLKAGLALDGYTTQALFLMGNGLDRFYTERIEEHPEEALELAQQIKRLTLPSEMGDRFQVIGLTRETSLALHGFKPRNQLHRLQPSNH